MMSSKSSSPTTTNCFAGRFAGSLRLSRVGTYAGEAGDGLEALDKAKVLRPDVVLMDINMPRMDGLGATRLIRREIPECKVVIVTQNHASIARQQGASVKASAAVTKADLTRDLRATVESVLGSPSAAAETRAADSWVPGGGALGHLVQEFDWASTPLGGIDAWPQSLKIAVRILLTSRFAMWMSWGPNSPSFITTPTPR
jgi:CheY-like chemotaxis protein